MLIYFLPWKYIFIPGILWSERSHHPPADVIGGKFSDVQMSHGAGARVKEVKFLIVHIKWTFSVEN